MAQEIPIEELQKGVQAVTWQHGVLSACVLLGSIVVAKAAGRFVRWAFSRNVRGPAFAFSKLLTYALIFAGLIAAGSLLGMPRSSLVLTSSALLVGVGFSLQPVARDVIAGIVILVEQSIRKHDFVSFGATMGTVQEIGLRATKLMTLDGTVLIVPNHLIVTTEVINHSHPLQRSRLRVDIPIDIGESTEEARAAIASVAAHHLEVLETPPPVVRLAAIDPGAFRFLLLAWVSEPLAAWRVASELRLAVSRLFEERGIRFATPTLTVGAHGALGAETVGGSEFPQPPVHG
jgi:small-conductance mechanosensitive channel